MSDDSFLNDVLSPALQHAANRRIPAEDHVLMTLMGASGEALIVTDRRVAIFREQIRMAALDAEVDSSLFYFDQVRDVEVEQSVGGGHLHVRLFDTPFDSERTTLFIPSSSLDRFEAAAARIRLLTGVDPTVAGIAAPEQSGAAMPFTVIGSCGQCGGRISSTAMFCPACGAPHQKACGGCGELLLPIANYCSSCGAAASLGRVLQCIGCGRSVAPQHAYCTDCGHPQGTVCSRCGKVAPPGWACCAHCGMSLAPASFGAVGTDDYGLSRGDSGSEGDYGSGLRGFEGSGETN